MRLVASVTTFMALTLAMPTAWAGAGDPGVDVGITAPAEGELTASDVLVTGITAVGGTTVRQHVLFVVDASPSTGGTFHDGGDDCDGDGAVDDGDDWNRNGLDGEVVDCEIAGVQALLDRLRDEDVAVGVVVHDGSARALDVDPVTEGLQHFAAAGADVDGDGEADVLAAARTAQPGGGRTKFDRPVRLANDLLDAAAARGALVVFMTDGHHNGGALEAELARADDAATVFEAFAVTRRSVGCDDGALRRIAATTGGSCTYLEHAADLAQSVATARPAPVDVDLLVDGVTLGRAESTPFGRTWTFAASLGPGRHVLTARATFRGTTATDQVGICVADGVASGPARVANDTVVRPASGELAASADDVTCDVVVGVGG